MRRQFEARLQALAVVCLVAVLALAATGARAATTVRVIETWPSDDTVLLGRNQVFYMRVAYSTDRPVSIRAKPFRRGVPVDAGSNPSPTYRGSGEALVWFFLDEAGLSVDEVRIQADNGGRRSAPVVAVWKGHVTAVSVPVGVGEEPEWVGRLRSEADAAMDKARVEAASVPDSPVIGMLFAGLVPVILAVGLVGLAAPFWFLRRWQGGWRLAALLPALLMGFVVLNIVIGVAIDTSSHNLWPFELLFSGGITLVYFLVLLGVRRWIVKPD